MQLNKSLTHYLIFGLLSWYLLVDMINGFLVLGLGINIKLSALYKSLILMLILVCWCSQNIKNLLYVAGLILVFLFSEAFYLMTGETTGGHFGFTFFHIIKIITPFVCFFFMAQLVKEDPENFVYVKRVININLAIFLCNMALGIAGFGFSTYGSDADGGLGVKGFFFAGNETSMVWVVLSAYLLNRVYMRGYRVGYLLTALLVLFIGVIISTKTSILATMLLILFTPIFIERSNLVNPRKPIAYFFFFFLLAIGISTYFLISFVLDSGFFDKITFFYNKRGLIGIILSGRELFFADLYAIMSAEDSIFRVLFGLGISFYGDVAIQAFTTNVKVDSELDLPDIFFWHGLVGVATILFLFGKMTWQSLKTCFNGQYEYGNSILLTNLLLFSIANITGHVFTSGMLGFLWALFNVLAFYQSTSASNKPNAS